MASGFNIQTRYLGQRGVQIPRERYSWLAFRFLRKLASEPARRFVMSCRVNGVAEAGHDMQFHVRGLLLRDRDRHNFAGEGDQIVRADSLVVIADTDPDRTTGEFFGTIDDRECIGGSRIRHPGEFAHSERIRHWREGGRATEPWFSR